MNLSELINALRRSWWLVAACLIVGAASAAGVTQVLPEQFDSTVSLLVAVVPDAGASPLQANSATVERVKSLVSVPMSTPVVDDVINRLSLSEGRAGLIRRISVSVPAETTVMNISVRDTDRQAAATLANTVGEAFSTRVATIDPSGTKIAVSVIQPAGPAPAPSSPRPLLNLAVGFLLGGVIGVTAAALRSRRRGVLSSPDAVELATGSTVLAQTAAPEYLSVLDALADRPAVRDEMYRRLRISLSRRCGASRAESPDVCLVCGDLSDTGTAWIAAQLALANAAAGARVLVIDIAGSPESTGQSVGLIDLLLQRVPVEEVLVTLPTTAGVTLLGWGLPDVRVVDPLGMSEMAKVLPRLAERFDCIVIRSSNIALSSDAALLSEHASKVLLVVQASDATSAAIAYAVEAVRRVTGSSPGIVLTSSPNRLGARRGSGTARRRGASKTALPRETRR